METLTAYHRWLEREAIPAGGIGPNEVDRLWDRHICDALAYALMVDDAPARACDVGTGVGLPGIPLAVVWPHTRWTLIDRSGRRTDLARRAVRVLALENVVVEQRSLEELEAPWPVVVSRATLPPDAAVEAIAPMLASDGLGIIGLRRGQRRPEPVLEARRNVRTGIEPLEVLDPCAWFLMIRRS